ncbi:hypothetical protein ABI59_05875 [Acidobacteria bacterium Mor1]|nr:hypothetical protein ABI59_05875 [Acidobacteria bacterium Mor1]
MSRLALAVWMVALAVLAPVPAGAACGDPPQLLDTLAGDIVFTVANDRLYFVTNHGCPPGTTPCVRITDLDGQLFAEFPTQGGAYSDIQALSNGRVFLSGSLGVERYLDTGGYLGLLDPGNIQDPGRMDVDSTGKLHVIDQGGSPDPPLSVRIYFPDSTFLTSYPVSSTVIDGFAVDDLARGHFIVSIPNQVEIHDGNGLQGAVPLDRLPDRANDIELDGDGHYYFNLSGATSGVEIANQEGFPVWSIGIDANDRTQVTDDGTIYAATPFQTIEVWSALDPDADGDGIADCVDPEPTIPDFDGDGLSQGVDCDDLNPACGLDCTDADGDAVCASNDCDDSINTCTDSCVDGDGDGVFLCAGDCDDAEAGCSFDCTDADNDGIATCAGDCDDFQAACAADCVTDLDGDGEPACSDCDDTRPGCRQDCVDNDGDGLCRFDDCDDTRADCGATCDGTCGDHCADEDSSSDIDGDGVPDCRDNCPLRADPSQADVDQDGVGDVCDCGISVTTATDGPYDGECVSDCTLREAVVLAQNGCGIRVPPGDFVVDGAFGNLRGVGAKALLGAGSDQSRILGTTFEGVAAGSPDAYLGGLYLDEVFVSEPGTYHIDSCAMGRLSLWEGIVNVRDSVISGGGIGVLADLGGLMYLTESTIRNSGTGVLAENGGGAGADPGRVFLNRCTVEDNGTGIRTEPRGPGPFGGFATIERSTIRGNDVGVLHEGEMLTISDSTIAENQGTGNEAGGIVLESGGAEVRSSTIVDNSAVNGAGGISGSGTVVLAGTIVANNGNGDCSTTVDSRGYNLIEQPTGCSIVGDTTGNILNQDPALGPLGDNGGSTETYRPLVGSPVIDAGSPVFPGTAFACSERDQAEVVRNLGECDIGSVEGDQNCLDFDGDGFGSAPSCSAPLDCNDAFGTIYPGAPELNDGLDNQCPGDLGYGVIDENSGTTGFFDPLDNRAYSWPVPVGATFHETVRAELPDMSLGCTPLALGDLTEVIDPAIPAAGGAFYYLTRPVLPNPGSYGADSGGTERVIPCADSCVDADGDGICAAIDCNDSNPACSDDCAPCQ